MSYDNLMGWIEDNYPIEDYDNYEDWITEVRDNFIFEEHVLPKQAEIIMQEKWEQTKGEQVISEREGQQEGEPIRIEQSEQPRQQSERVYDTRDIIGSDVKVATNREGDAVIAVNSNETLEQTQARLSRPLPRPTYKPTIANRIRAFVDRLFNRKDYGVDL